MTPVSTLYSTVITRSYRHVFPMVFEYHSSASFGQSQPIATTQKAPGVVLARKMQIDVVQQKVAAPFPLAHVEAITKLLPAHVSLWAALNCHWSGSYQRSPQNARARFTPVTITLTYVDYIISWMKHMRFLLTIVIIAKQLITDATNYVFICIVYLSV